MSATCTVLCSLPHGLIIERDLVVNPVTQTVTRGANYLAIKLSGSNTSSRIDLGPNPIERPPGITENVPLDFIENWLKEHADLVYVKNGMISIVKPSDVKAASTDMKQIKTGLEPLSTPKDVESRVPTWRASRATAPRHDPPVPPPPRADGATGVWGGRSNSSPKRFRSARLAVVSAGAAGAVAAIQNRVRQPG